MASVLVVDDDMVSRVLVRHILTAAGHRVTEAVDAQDGLDQFENRAGSFDVVISDQKMPGMSGIEFRQRLGSDLRVPFVLVSGHADQEELDLLGIDTTLIDAFLSKPVSTRALTAALGRVLGPSAAS